MKIRRKKHDQVFSLLVRQRANWTCENCMVVAEASTFDCAHIMGRRSVGLRWHPDNAIGLCRSCHIFFTGHPFDWNDFCIDKFGEERVAELRLISNKIVKWSPKVREEIYQFMRDQLKVQELGSDFEAHELMHKFGE